MGPTGINLYFMALYPNPWKRLLKEAFAGESKAQVRNQAFAQKATQEGYPQIAGLFRAVAEAERDSCRGILEIF